MPDLSMIPVLYVVYDGPKALELAQGPNKANLEKLVKEKFPGGQDLHLVPVVDVPAEVMVKMTMALLAEWLLMQMTLAAQMQSRGQFPGSRIVRPS